MIINLHLQSKDDLFPKPSSKSAIQKVNRKDALKYLQLSHQMPSLSLKASTLPSTETNVSCNICSKYFKKASDTNAIIKYQTEQNILQIFQIIIQSKETNLHSVTNRDQRPFTTISCSHVRTRA